MKVYVISSDKAKGAHLYSIASSSGCAATLSPNFDDDYRLVIDEVIEKHDLFDMMLVISDSPIPLSVELNKIEWAKAAVCNNGEEATEAREAMANIVIMNSRLLSETSANTIMRNILNVRVKHHRGKQENLMEEKREPKTMERPAHKKMEDRKKKTEDEEEYFDAKGKRRSLKERLRSSLGLGDA
jgi:ribose 5-phosphate isomerase RpiB